MTGNYKQLKAQIAKLEEEAAAARKIEAADAVATIKALIDEFDLSAEDLGFKTARRGATKGRTTGAPKYRDPATGKTWTGRGKPPTWMSAAIKEGKAELFLVEKAAPANRKSSRAPQTEAAAARGKAARVKNQGTKAATKTASKKATVKAAAKPKAPRPSRKKAVEVAPEVAASAPETVPVG